MIRDRRDFLDDMRDHALTAQAFVGTMSSEESRADTKTIFAVPRAIEIVGEAARRIPEEVPLAHNYDGADPRIIYDTATLFLPELVQRLSAMISALACGDDGPSGSG